MIDPPTRSARARGVLGLAVCWALAACGDGAPDVGTLDPVFAEPAEELRIERVGRGETLGQLLLEELEPNDQYAFLLSFREQASPRRIRAGTEVTFRAEAGMDEVRAIDVAINSDETVRLRRTGSGWDSETIETPVYADTLFASGQIESVLWTSVIRNPALDGIPVGDRNRLIDYLDRVFQWQVDFSRQIRVGDTYRFVFERQVRPDGSMRTGQLLAAELVNSGTAYHAIWFDPNGDGEGSYFDVEGKSVRRAFLLKPLEYRRISSRFTTGRFHPVLQRWRAHRGVDYAADAGTPIMATSDGVVVHRGPNGGYGNLVEIRHPNGFRTRYAHLSRFRSGVGLGTRVRQGDIIGYVGATGLVTGPHLHYEMLRSGSQIDPLSVDLPSGDPVPDDDRERWLAARNVRLGLLESIPGAGPVRTALTSAADAAGEGSAADERGG